MIVSCKRVSEELSAGLDHAHGPAKRAALKLHLLMCKGCRNFDAQLKIIRRAVETIWADRSESSFDADVAQINSEIELSEEARARIRAALD